jgi:hypothetical protein
MKQLTPQAFQRARAFLETQARPLDWAIFAHRFEGAPAEEVVSALAAFQNDDGGFGHALEPDVRTPSSSALATGIGLDVLRELGCDAQHPMVRHAVRFLLATHDPQTQTWRVAPHDTNDYPHAPWWHDEAGSLARAFDGFQIIPRAQIVGLLHHYAALTRAGGKGQEIEAGWLDAVTADTLTAIEAMPAERLSGDDLRYVLSLAETAALPARDRARLVHWLRAVVPAVVTRDPEQWGTYCTPPLKVAPTPASPVADLLWDDLQAYLDYQIAHQTAQGHWEPTWTWGDVYPEAWKQAKQAWRGHLTLETLTRLRAFGRLV